MTTSFPVDTQPLVLMHFLDVLEENFRGKHCEYTAQPSMTVPAHVLKPWRDRGYDPSETGIAVVTFFNDGNASKQYSYPLYFWHGV